MHKIVLDPALFSSGQYLNSVKQLETISHLEMIISFVKTAIDGEWDLYENVPYNYDMDKPPMTHYSYPILSRLININRDILELLNNPGGDPVQLTDIPIASLDPRFHLTLSCETDEAFRKYISYLHINKFDYYFLFRLKILKQIIQQVEQVVLVPHTKK